MSLKHLPKIFRLSLQQAKDAVGSQESVVDVLETFMKRGVIESYDVILEIKVKRDKASAIENYFMNQEWQHPTPIKKGKRNDDY